MNAPPLAHRFKTAGGGLLLVAIVALVGAAMPAASTARTAIQAAVVELGAGRLGLTGRDPRAPSPDAPSLALRALHGAGLGAAVAVTLCVAGLVTGGATARWFRPSAPVLALGFVVSAMAAARDELLLRGLPLTVLAGAPRWITLGAAGLVAAAHASTLDPVVPLGLATAALGGVALGALWVRDGGVWAPWGARFAWSYTMHTVLAGGVIDVRAAPTFWGGGDGGLDGGAAGVVVLSCVALFAGAAWKDYPPAPVRGISTS